MKKINVDVKCNVGDTAYYLDKGTLSSFTVREIKIVISQNQYSVEQYRIIYYDSVGAGFCNKSIFSSLDEIKENVENQFKKLEARNG